MVGRRGAVLAALLAGCSLAAGYYLPGEGGWGCAAPVLPPPPPPTP